jgi:hypothetical protein
VGAGARICADDDGISACVEAGVGAGVTAEFSSGLDKSTTELFVEGKVKYGVGSVTAGLTVAPCTFSIKGKANLGRLSAEAQLIKDGEIDPKLTRVSAKPDLPVSVDDLGKWKDLGLSLEGKAGARVCQQARW